MDNALMNEGLAVLLRKDSSLADYVLSGYFEEGDQKKLLVGLREISSALGGVTTLAKQAGLNPSLLSKGSGGYGIATLPAVPVLRLKRFTLMDRQGQ